MSDDDRESYIGKTVRAYFNADFCGIFEVKGNYRGVIMDQGHGGNRMLSFGGKPDRQVEVRYHGKLSINNEITSTARFEESKIIGMTLVGDSGED